VFDLGVISDCRPVNGQVLVYWEKKGKGKIGESDPSALTLKTFQERKQSPLHKRV
jgi:hypothetical protein